MATVTYLLSYDQQFANPTMGEARVRSIPGGVTVLPPIITVFLAIVTRNVLVSLFCGVWVAAFFIHACAPFLPAACISSDVEAQNLFACPMLNIARARRCSLPHACRFVHCTRAMFKLPSCRVITFK